MVTKQTNNYYRNFSKKCQNFEVSFIFFCFLDNLIMPKYAMKCFYISQYANIAECS